MPKRLAVLSITTVLIASILPACGGDDEEEDQIVDAITASITDPQPSDCTELQTQRFTEQVERASGKAAIRSCEADERDPTNDPDSVAVTDVQLGGDSATASVAFAGGIFDRQTLNVSLAIEDGQWKLDRIDEFSEFNRQALVGAFLKTTSSGADALPPKQAQCIAQKLLTTPSNQLQTALISSEEAAIATLFGGC